MLCMPTHELTGHAMNADVGINWKEANSDQTKIRHQSLKILTMGISHVGKCRYFSWDPRDYRNSMVIEFR